MKVRLNRLSDQPRYMSYVLGKRARMKRVKTEGRLLQISLYSDNDENLNSDPFCAGWERPAGGRKDEIHVHSFHHSSPVVELKLCAEFYCIKIEISCLE